MENNPFEILKHLDPKAIKKPEADEIVNSAQIQQNVRSENETAKITESSQIHYLQTEKTRDLLEKNHYTSSLLISKKEYGAMMRHRPLIKFRFIKNSFIKRGDLALLADSLNVPKNMVNTVINDTINYMLYINPDSMYYNPEKYKQDEYMQMLIKNDCLEKKIILDAEKEEEEKNYYRERADLIEPYIYRHGSKKQLTEYMKLELSDAKSALKKLYNILDTEGRGLLSYFARPIHVCDNRTLKKMQHIVKDGLANARDKGYITDDVYEQNVEWAIQKIYDIQSDNNLRSILKIALRNR